jgi:hypothetical protein
MHHDTASDGQHATPIPLTQRPPTARDVATMIGVTTDWVYAQSRRRRILTITLGRYRRYPPAAGSTNSNSTRQPDAETQISRDCPGRSRALGDSAPLDVRQSARARRGWAHMGVQK